MITVNVTLSYTNLRNGCQIVLPVVLMFLPIYNTTRRAKRIFQWASMVSRKNRIQVIGVSFDQGKRNLVRVNGEFELSEFKLTE